MTGLQSLDGHIRQLVGEPVPESGAEAIDLFCNAAAAVSGAWQASNGTQRGTLLRGLAAALEADREALVVLADRETALGLPRLNGELDRTTYQLSRFATIAEQGGPFRFVDSPAMGGAPPLGRPATQRWALPLGPVAMFAASNFPFAFSVLGGDTASALAAGCPVVVKAHPGHPRLSARVFALAQRVLDAQGLPAGLIGMVQGAGVEVGVRLIRHPAIAAGAFTGSTRGGAALQAEANTRPRPIPFYGELGSVNPVVALPSELARHGAGLAATLAVSITLGCGQFCTSPGVVVLIDANEYDQAANNGFVSALMQALAAQQLHPMLTPGMRSNFEAGVARWAEAGATMLLHANASAAAPLPVLAQVQAPDFIGLPALREEVFGPASLVVRARSLTETLHVLQAVGGSLTVTLWGADNETPDTLALVRGAMAVAGRVLFAGVPTGVAVTAAQQHGGPWPASTHALSTSVGDAALQRFLRPVALQDAPAWLLARQGRPA